MNLTAVKPSPRSLGTHQEPVSPKYLWIGLYQEIFSLRSFKKRQTDIFLFREVPCSAALYNWRAGFHNPLVGGWDILIGVRAGVGNMEQGTPSISSLLMGANYTPLMS